MQSRLGLEGGRGRSFGVGDEVEEESKTGLKNRKNSNDLLRLAITVDQLAMKVDL
jgi:hypothetical protein